MANAVLIVLASVFAVLIVIASVYFLVYFQHPDDRLVAWFPKFMVVSCLSLAAYNVFLLPLDIANTGGVVQTTGSTINLYPVNMGFFIASCVIVIAVIPFTVFFYEGVDDSDESDTKKKSSSQIQYALKWTIPTMIFAGAAIGLFWWLGGSAAVPRTVFTGNLQLTQVLNSTVQVQTPNVLYDYCLTFKGIYSGLTQQDSTYMASLNLYGLPCSVSHNVIWVTVSVIIYMLALTSFVGTILFSVFAGVGLITLPFDLIFGFLHRPKPIKQAEYEEKKKILGEQAKLLTEAGKIIMEEVRMATRRGKTIFDKSERRLRKKDQEFRRDVMILEYHWRWLEDSYKHQGGNLILQIALFSFGILGAVMSVAWIIHIMLYVIPMMLGYTYIALVLNGLMESVGSIPFIGILIYVFLAFYLLFCVIKGNNKLGMRFVFLFSIHPMQVGETFMNSLLFNIGIILLCSLACVQFLTLAFYDYASYTAANQIFNIQIQNLKGLHYGWNVFVFVLISIVGITLLYVIYKPYHKQRENSLLLKFRA